LNIIEHLWEYLDRRVRTRQTPPTNLMELWDALVEEWGNIEQDYIDRLFDSMPRRIAAVIAAKGGYTKY
ncbi:hypothetical protein BDN72DRAFT_733519, partial [Pluteus cervinus]